MSRFIAFKQEMSQIFTAAGAVTPVTLLKVPEWGEGELTEGETVAVSGLSKGRGFQGVVKRHGFHGGSRTHGQKPSERGPGAIGGGGRAGGRVPMGMRMAGRMGGVRVTVKNLKVVKIDRERGELLIAGAIPGRRGTRIELKLSAVSQKLSA